MDTNFQAIARIYRAIIDKRAQPHTQLVQFKLLTSIAEDESGAPPTIEYNPKTDRMDGSCGPKCKHCEAHQGKGKCDPKCLTCVHHKCDFRHTVSIGDDDQSFQRMVNSFTNDVRGTYVRIMVVNPLVSWLPKLVCFICSTCNRFDAHPHVSEQWQIASACFKKHLGPLHMEEIGKDSDGDARRYALQAAAMAKKHAHSLTLEDESFTICGKINQDGSVSEVHQQDPKHNVAKVDAGTRGIKLLQVGDQANDGTQIGGNLATANHLRLVKYNSYFTFEEHKLRISDIHATDRQSKTRVARSCSLFVDNCLARIDVGGEQGIPKANVSGSRAIYRMNRQYLRIYFSKTATLLQRIEFAGYNVMFMRLLRVYVKAEPNLTLKKNFYPAQTYRHFIHSNMVAVLIIRAHRLRCPDQPCGLTESGSDCCEVKFSGVSGCGAIASHIRDASFGQFVYMIAKDFQLQMYQSEGMRRPVSNKKQEIDPRLLEEDGPAADLTDYASDVEEENAFVAGGKRAIADAIRISMRSRNQAWFARPWLCEHLDVLQMRQEPLDEEEGDGQKDNSDTDDSSGESGERSDDRARSAAPGKSSGNVDPKVPDAEESTAALTYYGIEMKPPVPRLACNLSHFEEQAFDGEENLLLCGMQVWRFR